MVAEGMSMRPAHPLRAVTQAEERALQRIAKATSERVDVVQRAQALLAVKAGKGYTAAAREAGYKSGDSISQLVERFNQHGLAALHIAAGRGRKVTYTPAQRERIVQELKRVPDRSRYDRHLVAQNARNGLAQGSAAPGREDDHPGGAAGGGLSLWQDAHLVSDGNRHPRAQSRNGAGPGSQSHEKKP